MLIIKKSIMNIFDFCSISYTLLCRQKNVAVKTIIILTVRTNIYRYIIYIKNSYAMKYIMYLSSFFDYSSTGHKRSQFEIHLKA